MRCVVVCSYVYISPKMECLFSHRGALLKPIVSFPKIREKAKRDMSFAYTQGILPPSSSS